MPHVELRRVTKRYGSVTAVSDLTLTVEKGSFTALLGSVGLRQVHAFADDRRP